MTPSSGLFERTLAPVLRRAVTEFPAVVLTGPRQSGKTTLLLHLFRESHRYLSLEPPDVRAAAQADPRGFVELYPPPVIFDEAQYAPGLLPYIKERIDGARDRPGQYLLTGSQNLLPMERVSESLAGRAAILRLLPLSWRERAGVPDVPLPWEGGGRPASPSCRLRSCGRPCCWVASRSWPAARRATPPSGTAATSRPTWSATYARCAR